jgi:hypothetical protein
MDTTAPIISQFSIDKDKVTETTAEANVIVREEGTCYYVVLESNETTPLTGEEITQSNAKLKGTVAIRSNTKTSVTLSGLKANTNYKAYAIVKNQAGNASNVSVVTFTTKNTTSSEDSSTYDSGENSEENTSDTI